MIGHPRARARRVVDAGARPLRLRYYTGTRAATFLVVRLPRRLRSRLGLDDTATVLSRRIEIGGGHSPLPGYIHVDIDPRARHVEVLGPAWDLPFPDGWASEIVAIHVLEHVPPTRLQATLVEWRRVLAAGGLVRVHVPNGPELMDAYLRGDAVSKWRAAAALLGMSASPQTPGPDALVHRADHQSILDEELVEALLCRAGFANVTNRTGSITDLHTEAWSALVPHCSLIFEGVRP